MAASTTLQKQPARLHWVLFGLVALAACFLFVHPDVIETANHSYVLLESLFQGRFLEFYNDVAAHQNALYYINGAHYNIALYLIFALAELPIFVVNTLFSLPVNEASLYFTGKLVSIGFFAGCLCLMPAIARQLGLNQTSSRWAPLYTALWPPAFFAVVVMGQYDSICLFFVLLGFLYWLRGQTLRFALWFGLGASFKFFALLLFIPLLLLREKRPLHIMKNGVFALWLLVPTTLLFHGRTANMAAFNDAMMSRLFAEKLPGAQPIPVFPLLFCLLCFVAFLWRPEKGALGRAGLWLCTAALGLLFLLVDWHPQWIVLLAPFVVLGTFYEKNRVPWFWADIVLTAGFFLYCAVTHPNQLEANLMDFGLVGLLGGVRTTSMPAHIALLDLYNRLPMVSALPMVLFGAALVAHLALKFPLRGGTPATRLSAAGTTGQTNRLGFYAWFVFCAGLAVWLLPTLFTWFSCFGLVSP